MSRAKLAMASATLLGFATTLSIGCGGTEVPVTTQVPPTQAGPTKPLPKEKTQGGGAGSSGNMKRNPGASS